MKQTDKKPIKVLITAGMYKNKRNKDGSYGHKSVFADRLYGAVREYMDTHGIKYEACLLNGGSFNALSDRVDELCGHDILFWFPDTIEIARMAYKRIENKAGTAVMLKNNNGQYTARQITKYARRCGADLVFETKESDKNTPCIRIFDTDGCILYEGTDVKEMAVRSMDRLISVKKQ